MIAADTSTWINFYQNVDLPEVAQLVQALETCTLVMPPPVLTELLSSLYLSEKDKTDLTLLPRLEIVTGYWERSGQLRYQLLKKKLKARSLDCFIAQICMDHQICLITNDKDFRHFTKFGLLSLP